MDLKFLSWYCRPPPLDSFWLLIIVPKNYSLFLLVREERAWINVEWEIAVAIHTYVGIGRTCYPPLYIFVGFKSIVFNTFTYVCVYKFVWRWKISVLYRKLCHCYSFHRRQWSSVLYFEDMIVKDMTNDEGNHLFIPSRKRSALIGTKCKIILLFVFYSKKKIKLKIKKKKKYCKCQINAFIHTVWAWEFNYNTKHQIIQLLINFFIFR